jgi:Ca2+-transporting ATPase
VTVAAKAGLKKDVFETEWPRIDEVPFTSERKYMVTLHGRGAAASDAAATLADNAAMADTAATTAHNDEAAAHASLARLLPSDDSAATRVAFAKGAPEVILSLCDRYLTDAGPRALDDGTRADIGDVTRRFAADALRLMAVAYEITNDLSGERRMVFLGVIGMIAPPRPEVSDAVATCERAGIRSIMITGDHPDTARAVAHSIGLARHQGLLTGAELSETSDDALDDMVDDIGIYARVSPEHKLRVINAWKRRGQIVAMTGDGVNDAPALKRADIGIAMGITGTDVSKAAADMTLTDDNFASIVGAVEEGRAIFTNIKKYLTYLLSSNIGEVLLLAIAAFAGLPLPLTAVQILYVNLATDGLPALALAVDPNEEDLMQRPPRDPRHSIFTRPILALMVTGGVWSAFINLSLFMWALDTGRSLEQARTMTFVALVVIQFLKAYAFRSDRLSTLRHPLANKWLNLAIVWELALLGAIVYVPFLHEPFSTFALTRSDWLIILGVTATIIPVLELVKLFIRRGQSGQAPAVSQQ